jgi:Ran GTPase-activating protein (RanGAP) involved in mRNA processing and transport
MPYVAGFLKETSTLRELYLSRNLIEDPGLISLSKGLFVNTSLEIIDLAYNRIRGLKSELEL